MLQGQELLINARRIKILIKNLQNPELDKRTLKITKKEQYNYIELVDWKIISGILPRPESPNENHILDTLIYFHLFQTREHQKYIRLNTKNLLLLLKYTDNAIILILADQGVHLSYRTRLYTLRNLHSMHKKAIIEKYEREGYTIPLQLQPKRVKIKIGDK